jgi:hypothetical protein
MRGGCPSSVAIAFKASLYKQLLSDRIRWIHKIEEVEEGEELAKYSFSPSKTIRRTSSLN